jgi:chromosome segregation ATPase
MRDGPGELRKRKQLLESENEKLRRYIDQLERQRERLEKERNRFKQQRDKLKEQRDELEQQRDQLEEQVDGQAIDKPLPFVGRKDARQRKLSTNARDEARDIPATIGKFPSRLMNVWRWA